MSKPSWAVEDEDLWRFIAEVHQRKGYTPSQAHDLIILEWLSQGDAGPLVYTIKAGHRPGDDALQLIADMLARDDSLPYHLTVRRRLSKGGAHDKPGKAWRDLLIATEYKEQRGLLGSSDKAFAATADKLGMSVSNVRTAVTAYRQLCQRARARNNK